MQPAADSPRMIWPKPQTTKTLGVMNIIFGSLLIMMFLLTAASLLVAPLMKPLVQNATAQATARIKAQRESELKQLEDRLAAAETEEVKAQIRADLEKKKAEPLPDPTGGAAMTIEGMNTPAVVIYNWTWVATGLAVNIALIVAGVGLIRLKESGRRLSVRVAWAKIALIAAFLFWELVFILPLVSKAMGPQLEQMRKAFGQNSFMDKFLSPEGMRAYSIFVYCLTAIFSLAYPIFMLVLATRPGVVAACRQRAKPESNQSW